MPPTTYQTDSEKLLKNGDFKDTLELQDYLYKKTGCFAHQLILDEVLKLLSKKD